MAIQVVLLGTATLGITIHHSTFLCTRVNEPIMTMVAGQMKNIISTILGALIFSDFVFSWLNVTGLLISMIGLKSLLFISLFLTQITCRSVVVRC